jgi:ATP-dependent Zn protease
MVHRYGMGDGDLSGAVGSYAKSDKMKEKFDEATFRIVQNCLADASYMLEDNKEKLSDLTSVLLEKEMLSGQEVCDIVGGPRGVRKKR